MYNKSYEDALTEMSVGHGLVSLISCLSQRTGCLQALNNNTVASYSLACYPSFVAFSALLLDNLRCMRLRQNIELVTSGSSLTLNDQMSFSLGSLGLRLEEVE